MCTMKCSFHIKFKIKKLIECKWEEWVDSPYKGGLLGMLPRTFHGSICTVPMKYFYLCLHVLQATSTCTYMYVWYKKYRTVSQKTVKNN